MFSCESNWYIFSEHFCLYKLKNKIDNCNHCVTGRYKEPPREIPHFLKSAYSYQNRVSIGKWYLNRDFGDPNGRSWPNEMIEDMIRAYKGKTLEGNYGREAVESIRKVIAKEYFNVRDKDILVIGSQFPWIESILLAEGATSVKTLEYNPIQIEHPQLQALMPYEMAEMVKDGQTPFDGIISFSSLEHSGLGRYGDQMNPWGDLIAMAR